jgi:DNA polymerase III subunit beta
MKFITTVQRFNSELSAVVDAAEKKAIIPVLQYALIEARGAITLAATNLDHRLTTAFDAEISEPGALLVNADKLHRLLKSLNQAAELEARTEGEALLLKCERGKFKLPGLPEAHFPAPLGITGEAIELPAALLARALAATRDAVTTEESRYALAGAKLELEAGCARLIATDGHRLHLAEFPVAARAVETLIPKAALPLVAGLCEGAEVISLEISDKGLRFTAGRRALETRVLAGVYPNWRLAVPQARPIQIKLEAAELLARLKRIGQFGSQEDNKNRRLACELSPGSLGLVTQNQVDATEAEELLPVEYDGAPITFRLAVEYLAEAAAVVGGEVVIGIKDPESQITVTSVEQNELSVTAVVMTMRK